LASCKNALLRDAVDGHRGIEKIRLGLVAGLNDNGWLKGLDFGQPSRAIDANRLRAAGRRTRDELLAGSTQFPPATKPLGTLGGLKTLGYVRERRTTAQEQERAEEPCTRASHGC
jgi:hypothetical protein